MLRTPDRGRRKCFSEAIMREYRSGMRDKQAHRGLGEEENRQGAILNRQDAKDYYDRFAGKERTERRRNGVSVNGELNRPERKGPKGRHSPTPLVLHFCYPETSGARVRLHRLLSARSIVVLMSFF